MKNEIIDRVLQKHPDDRIPVEYLYIFAWILENTRHDEKCKADFEALLIKFHKRDVDGVANFDIPVPSQITP